MNPRYKIGMRTVKTVIAVGICLIVFQFIRPITNIDGIQAALAATICMKSSLQNTLRTGIDRAVGTVMGSIIGVAFLLLSHVLPVYLVSAIGIIGVLLIIYLCNVLRLQASVTISIVVFLIILIGESDIPPIMYGLARLGETIFGIFVAYVINRFLNVRRHKQPVFIDGNAQTEGLREATEADIGAIMQIWLKTNIGAHTFMDDIYWHQHYDEARAAIKDAAHTVVYTGGGQILGFISLSAEAEIIAASVVKQGQHQGIGVRLIDYAKDIFPCLTIRCFKKNESTVKFLLNRGFLVDNEERHEKTGLTEYVMLWSRKHSTVADEPET